MTENTNGVPIRIAARKTGLTAHVIRAWEKRYKAVKPARTETNRRLYSASDLARLSRLRELVEAGFSIGQVASLPDEQLNGLLGDLPDHPGSLNGNIETPWLERCWEATERMDSRSLDDHLQRGLLEIGYLSLLDEVILPLLIKIGDCWEQEKLGIAQEHLASSVIRTFLGQLASQIQPDHRSPVAVIGTPSGQPHELGAMIFGIAAATAGWRVLYLGSDLPVQEIKRAAQESQARLVALSLMHPQEEEAAVSRILHLRRELPAEMQLLLGGPRIPDSIRLRASGITIDRSRAGVGHLVELSRALKERISKA